MFAFDHSRKEKEPVVAEAVEEVKTEPVLVCPPLRSRAYTPPDDLQSRLESCLKEVLGSSLPSNWQDISLDDGHVKFRLLAHLADDLGHAVPNSRLHQMCRVGDVLDFYNVPSVQDRSKFDELVAGNLPPNLKISWGYWAGQQLAHWDVVLSSLRWPTNLVKCYPSELFSNLPSFTVLFFPIEEYIFFSHEESAKKTFSHLLKLSPQPPIKSSFDNLCNVRILMFIVSALERTEVIAWIHI